MTKSPAPIPPLSPEEAAEMLRRVDVTVREFRGNFDELESALGMLLLGRLVGWKVLALIHNKRTIRKYEQILGISIREEFCEEGPLAHKSVAYEVVKKLGQYWKAVSGDVRVQDRRELKDG